MLNNLRSRLANMIRPKAASGQVLIDSDVGWTNYLRQTGVNDNIPSDPRFLVNQYRSWVYVCATTNARFLSTLNLRLYVRMPKNSAKVRFLRDVRPLEKEHAAYLRGQMHLKAATGDPSDDLLEVMEHPFLDFLRAGDDELTGHEAMQLTDLYQELTGDGYWYVTRNSRGVPEQYTVLPSQYTRIIAPDGVVIRYEVGIEPDVVKFSPDEVIHFRFPSPFNMLYGYGPGHAAYGESNFDGTQLELEKSMQANNNIPAGLLTPDLQTPLTKVQMDQFTEQWNKHHGGVPNAGKLGLSPLPLKLIQFALDPRRVEMLARRRASRDEIAAVFGMSPTMLDMSKSDASAVQGDITYQRNTILPRARLKEARLNRDLVSAYGDPHLFCAHDNPVPADRQYKLLQAQAMAQVSDLFFVNEVRRAFGADPDPKRNDELYSHAPVGSFAGPSNDDGSR